MDFRYPQGMHFPQEYSHNRPLEKELELFSNTKINVAKVGTEKEDEKIMESGFYTSLDMVVKMQKLYFLVIFC